MILCPKCQQPLGKNHRCFLVPQDVQAKREMAALDGLLKRMGNAITEQHNQINLLWSYARGLERRLDQLTKKVQETHYKENSSTSETSEKIIFD